MIWRAPRPGKYTKSLTLRLCPRRCPVTARMPPSSPLSPTASTRDKTTHFGGRALGIQGLQTSSVHKRWVLLWYVVACKTRVVDMAEMQNQKSGCYCACSNIYCKHKHRVSPVGGAYSKSSASKYGCMSRQRKGFDFWLAMFHSTVLLSLEDLCGVLQQYSK